ncbi:BAIP2 protein, partial [Atractosteus spatula]|nr:BAIP2 protein [Atractosteus spatula]
AASGGVCALVGDSCCTYIPADDDDYGNLTLAIQHLKELKDKVNKERGIKDTPAFLSWLESLFGPGGMFSVILKQFNLSLKNFVSMVKQYEKALTGVTAATEDYFDMLVKLGEAGAGGRGRAAQ